jgi:hypothetical protein
VFTCGYRDDFNEEIDNGAERETRGYVNAIVQPDERYKTLISAAVSVKAKIVSESHAPHALLWMPAWRARRASSNRIWLGFQCCEMTERVCRTNL